MAIVLVEQYLRLRRELADSFVVSWSVEAAGVCRATARAMLGSAVRDRLALLAPC